MKPENRKVPDDDRTEGGCAILLMFMIITLGLIALIAIAAFL